MNAIIYLFIIISSRLIFFHKIINRRSNQILWIKISWMDGRTSYKEKNYLLHKQLVSGWNIETIDSGCLLGCCNGYWILICVFPLLLFIDLSSCEGRKRKELDDYLGYICLGSLEMWGELKKRNGKESHFPMFGSRMKWKMMYKNRTINKKIEKKVKICSYFLKKIYGFSYAHSLYKSCSIFYFYFCFAFLAIYTWQKVEILTSLFTTTSLTFFLNYFKSKFWIYMKKWHTKSN